MDATASSSSSPAGTAIKKSRRQRQVKINYDAAPIVKWAGGKTKLLPELLRRMPASYGRYHEPFVGGGALFFRAAPVRASLCDANTDLMDTYRAVAIDVEAVISALLDHAKWHRESAGHYYSTRDLWNNRSTRVLTSAQRAAAFIYLNKTCFNGLFRVNASGGFNVPRGDYEDPAICNGTALRVASAALSSATLHSGDYRQALGVVDGVVDGVVAGDYRQALDGVVAGDYVYLDPPYDGTFASYTAGKFAADEQLALAGVVRSLVDRGVMVMASNADTPFVRELYAGYRIDSVRCARSINSNGAKRGSVGEVVVMAGYDA
jgi:DNA adenine methylase